MSSVRCFRRLWRAIAGQPLCLLPLLVAILLLAAPTQAQAQNAAPLAFKNQTNMTLEIEGESIIDNNGNSVPLFVNWTMKPGQYSWLGDTANQKIFAKKFLYRVKTAGKTSNWECILNGPAANGYFTVTFSQDNLRYHLGQMVVAKFPPQMQDAPTQQQMQNALGKVIIAAIAHAAANELARKPNPNLGDVFAETLARGIRDAAVQGAVQDLFPKLTWGQSSDIKLLIGKALDGRLNFQNLDQQAAKQRLINDLQANHPNLANAAVIADFVYAAYQWSQQRRKQ